MKPSPFDFQHWPYSCTETIYVWVKSEQSVWPNGFVEMSVWRNDRVAKCLCDEMSVWRNVLWRSVWSRNVCVTKWPCCEMSVCRNVCVTKWPCCEMSVWRNVHVTKCLVTKCKCDQMVVCVHVCVYFGYIIYLSLSEWVSMRQCVSTTVCRSEWVCGSNSFKFMHILGKFELFRQTTIMVGRVCMLTMIELNINPHLFLISLPEPSMDFTQVSSFYLERRNK